MRDKSVVLSVDYTKKSPNIKNLKLRGKVYAGTPLKVYKALHSDSAGYTVPRIVVFDPKVETLFGAVSYDQLKSGATFDAIYKAMNDGMSKFRNNSFLGTYEHIPVKNDWHKVTIESSTDGKLLWKNAAGRQWAMEIRNGNELWSGKDCPYGEQKLAIKNDQAGQVISLEFNGGQWRLLPKTKGDLTGKWTYTWGGGPDAVQHTIHFKPDGHFVGRDNANGKSHTGTYQVEESPFIGLELISKLDAGDSGHIAWRNHGSQDAARDLFEFIDANTIQIGYNTQTTVMTRTVAGSSNASVSTDPPTPQQSQNEQPTTQPSENDHPTTIADQSFKLADAELNSTYKLLQSRLQSASQKSELTKAQKAWIAFRDSDATFRAGVSSGGGSAYSMDYLANLTELTEQRAKELKALLQ